MGDDYKAFVSAVVYVRNNEDALGSFLRTIANELRSNFSEVEIICVDDASEDRSLEVIREEFSNLENVETAIVRFGFRQGREASIRAGDDISIGDYVIEFDSARLDFDPSAIMKAYKKMLEGYDIVGVAPAGKRRLSSRLFYKTMNKSLDIVNELDTETFRILSRRALNRVESSSQIIPYRKAVYANSGLPQTVIRDNSEEARTARRSHHDGVEGRYRIDVAVESIVLFTQTGYKLALGLSLFMMAVALFMICYSFFCYFAGITVAGWTTTVLFLAFAFFGLFGILAIVIKYLQIIVNLVFKKKPYMFESIDRG